MRLSLSKTSSIGVKKCISWAKNENAKGGELTVILSTRKAGGMAGRLRSRRSQKVFSGVVVGFFKDDSINFTLFSVRGPEPPAIIFCSYHLRRCD